MADEVRKPPLSAAMRAARVVGIYAAASFVWIAWSDFVVYRIVRDPELAQRIATLKGWFFVGVTTALLYRTIRNSLAKNDAAMAVLGRQLRALQVINRCDAAIWSLRTRQELFEEICRLAVQAGGYRMAWVGLPVDDADRAVRVAARAGANGEFLEGARFVWSDTPRGQSAVGECLRTGGAQSRRLPDDAARLEPWREAWRLAEFQSVGTVPFLQGGRAVGALVLYSSRPEAFDDAETALLDRLGKSISYALDFLDKSEKERTLVEELQKLAHAIDSSPVSVVITDAKASIEFVNRKFTEVTGYSADEVRGRNPRLLKTGETSAEEYRRLWATVSGGGIWQGVFHNRRKDGGTFWEFATISPVMGEDGVIRNYIAVKEDLTEKRALESQLRQAQKMESLGALAGGVAHDFNNLLTVIGGHCELLALSEPITPDAASSIADIRSAAERAAALTKRLLQFGRKHPMLLRRVELGEVVRDSGRMLGRLLGENYELEFSMPAEPLPLSADPAMLEQVLMNLVLNARDAMPSGGRIRVEISEAARTLALPPGVEPAPQGWALLSVTDSGCGIPPADRQRIFEPFFTTKEIGKGTGLGLSVVDGIVRQHRGWVAVDDAAGGGAVFNVYLPRGSEPAAAAPAPDASAPARGTERILYVEDDEALRALTARVLRGYGYDVTEAESGPAGLARWSERTRPFALLLTDMVMPGGMTGAELGRRLRADAPGLRVLVTSGYHRELPPAGGDEFAFLGKPFAYAALARALRAALDRA